MTDLLLYMKNLGFVERMWMEMLDGNESDNWVQAVRAIMF